MKENREYPYLYRVEPTVWREARISARLTKQMFDAVEAKRRAENISRSELICRALDAYFSAQK